MSKILLKRHKRQVLRANQRVRQSEPDVRTPEQVRAAREASQPAGGWRNGEQAHFAKPSIQKQVGSEDPAAKADV